MNQDSKPVYCLFVSDKLKKTMGLIGETTDEVVRKKKMAELREIGTNVQVRKDR